MGIPRFVYMAVGAGVMGAVRGAGKGMGRGMGSGMGTSSATGLHDLAVRVVAAGMQAADVVGSATQTIADEAADINAEARRKARIDAVVRERLAPLEKDIRAEVAAEVDAIDAGVDADSGTDE